MKTVLLSVLTCFVSFGKAQYLTNGTFAKKGTYGVRYDTGSFGPDVEVFHYFFDQWREHILPFAAALPTFEC